MYIGTQRSRDTEGCCNVMVNQHPVEGKKKGRLVFPEQAPTLCRLSARCVSTTVSYTESPTVPWHGYHDPCWMEEPG